LHSGPCFPERQQDSNRNPWFFVIFLALLFKSVFLAFLAFFAVDFFSAQPCPVYY
jgi:hypothetical protein